MTETIQNKKYRQVWIWVFILLFVISGTRLLFKVKGDYLIYYDSIKYSLSGSPEKVYTQEGDGFFYMPFAYLLMHPIGWFPIKVSRIIHHFIESALLMLSCLMFLKLALPEKKYVPYLMGVTLILTSRFLHNNYGYGQMNVIILFNIIAGIFFFHRNKYVLAALFMAVAVSFKITPVIFVLYFLLKKEFRFVLYIITTVVFLNFILPLAFWGIEGGFAVCKEWMFSQYKLGSSYMTKYSNYSFLSLLFRYLTEYSWSDKSGGCCPGNILSLSRSNTLIAYSACAAAVMWGFIRKFGKSMKEIRTMHPDGNLFLAMLPEYSIVIIIMLLFSPVSWQHHFTLLFIPHFCVTYYLLKNRIENNKMIFSLVVASFIVGGLTTPVFMGVDFSRTLMNYSAITISALLLLAAVTLCSVRNFKENTGK